jgi:FMN phosphatase YigB (HAD superfamily)
VSLPKIVLFDLGGVLLPFDREQRIGVIVRRMGCTAEAARDFMARDIHHGLDTGEADAFDLAAAFGEALGAPISPADACDLVCSVFEEPNHDLWDLADRLRGRVVVGGFSDNPSFVLRAFPPSAFLDPMFFSAQIKACKPSDEAFAAVEMSLGMQGDEILFIDDTAANVAAARRRGWDAIHFTANDALIAELARRGLP